MTIKQDISLKNRQIDINDMKNFCSILEENKITYTCTIHIKDEKKYIYKYTPKTTEENIFKTDKLKNIKIEKITIDSKRCKLYYGLDTYNNISFTAEENDSTYNNLFAKFIEWKSRLKKLKRFEYGVPLGVFSGIILFALSVGYFILSFLIRKNLLVSSLSATALFILLFVTLITYTEGFKTYQINIGDKPYKRYQTAFYYLISSCIIPICIGLIF